MTASIAIKKNFEILSKLTHDKISIDCILTKNAKKFPIISKTENGVALNSLMSNSFGFGVTNSALIFERV